MANANINFTPYMTGAQLKSIRALRGMTQQELATLAGVTQAAITGFESGKRDIRTDTLRKICAALNVQVQYIVGDTIFKN